MVETSAIRDGPDTVMGFQGSAVGIIATGGQIPIEPAAPTALHLPRFPALAVCRRRPAVGVAASVRPASANVHNKREVTARNYRGLPFGGLLAGKRKVQTTRDEGALTMAVVAAL